MPHHLDSFRLEEYLAPREFAAQYMFCASDLESRTIQQVLDLLSPKEKELFLNLPLSYTHTQGDIQLRQQIASLYRKIHADNVLCFAGAEEAIYATARVFLKSQDHAIAITPCYQSLKSVAKSICSISTVDLELIHGEWALNVDRIAQQIRPNTRVLFLNFPHNPTGFVPSSEVFQSIMDLAQAHGIIVFSDEVYRGIELNPQDQLPSASELYSEAISLGVMSKSFGFAGLRIGWVTSQNPELLSKLSKFKHYLSICNSAPSEWLATAILRNSDIVLRENNRLVKENYKIVKNYFKTQPHLFQWIEPKGGCTAYPKYLGAGNIQSIAEQLLQNKGVVILPDWVYEQNNQHFRISFGRKNCPEALKHFSDFFSEYKTR
ncbi:MAG: aminotransferase class I/II-fold pyridoxal phosphate-dependent enzyme [Zetaproteobacteria bacterium]|nr:aminotransferase class I/II-fold pyridoxal phosphate-dependent enzyme [Zetaproteobacteria bacterium]